MKTRNILIFVAIAIGAFASNVQAYQSERIMTITLSGFFQSRDAFGDDLAVPFRKMTKDFLEELSVLKNQDFTNGVLLVVDHPDDTNALTQIFARKGTNPAVEVSEFFEFELGDAVVTAKYPGGVFKSATFYAIDYFRFNTLNTDTNGVDVTLQCLSKETQTSGVKTIGGVATTVVNPGLKSDGNGEYLDSLGLYGPVKGTIKIGKPKFLP